MNRVSIVPATEQEWLALRTNDITSTDVAALFGVSAYLTEFELWHRKRDKLVGDFEESERMAWGTALQDGIAAKIASDQNWIVRRMNEYGRIPELRIGASFDFSIEGEPITPDEYAAGKISDWPPEKCGILEIKNVDSRVFKQGWLVEPLEGGGEWVEAPPHIELQVQHQMLVSGRSYAYIGALIGGNKEVLIRREADAKIAAAILAKVASFWKSVDEDREPAPNFNRDAAFISKLFGYAEPGKVLDAADKPELAELMASYAIEAELEKKAEARKKAIKAQVLTIIGDAEKVYGTEWTLSAGQVGPARYTVDRRGYRLFKPTWRMEK